MHIGIILDGNRRWAVKNGFPKLYGHKKGLENLENILKILPKYKIKTFTVYALSTENLQRSAEELENLFSLITEFSSKTKKFVDNNIKVKVLGNTSLLSDDCQKSLQNLEDETKENDGLLFQICLAYGGRDEIVRAVQRTLAKNQEVNEANLSENLDSSLEPDIIIRTGGRKRLSNFLAWQSTYAELVFLEKMWPDFGEEDLKSILKNFEEESRTFGK